MRTYEYPLGVTFKASTPEHAAARVFGGKPWNYLATENANYYGDRFVEVYRFLGVEDETAVYDFMGDIPIVEGD